MSFKIGDKVKWIYNKINFEGIVKEIGKMDYEITVDFAPNINTWTHECDGQFPGRTGRYFKSNTREQEDIKYIVSLEPKKPLTFKSFMAANKNE